MKNLVFVLLLCTTACSMPSKNSFIHKDHTRTIMDLKVNLFSNKKEMIKALSKNHKNLAKLAKLLPEGVAVWYTVPNGCEIYVYEPKTDEDVNTWGHELMHCVYGNWHL